MRLFALLSLASTFLVLGLGVVVYAQDTRRRTNRAFLVLCLAVAGWGFCEFQLRTVTSAEAARLWGRLFTLWPLVVAAYLRFAVVYTHRLTPRRARQALAFAYGPALVFVLAGLFPDVVQSPPVRTTWGYTYGLPTDMRIRHVAITWSVAACALGLGLVLWNRRAASSPAARRQGTFIAVGLGLPAVAGGITEAALHVVRIRVPEMTVTAFALGCLLIGYGVWRHGLFRLSGAQVAPAIVSSLRDAILAVDTRGRIAAVNPPASEMVQWPAPALVGMELATVLSADSEALLTRLQREPQLEGETTLRTREGERVPVTYRSSRLSASAGAPRGYTLVLRDQRARRDAEAASRLQLQFNHAVINSLPGVFYLIRADGTFARWNERFEALTGYGAEEMTALHLTDVFSDTEGLAVAERVEAALRTGESAVVEADLQTKAGARVPHYFTMRRATLGDDHYLTGMGVDISERKRLEGELLQSQKMQAVGTLAGGIAHDFNNLLTVILGFAEMALAELPAGPTGEGEPALREPITQILSAGHSAAQLTRQLLQFSRKQPMARERVSLEQRVAPLSAMLERLVGEDIRLEVTAAADLGRVWVDVASLEQVLVNLVVNARDAMPQGGRIELRLENRTVDPDARQMARGALPGRYTRLRVMDQGIGMDPSTLEHIFEPFFSTKATGQGTGLGLSVVYGIVRQLDGWIDVRSEPGVGTRFDVYLPHADPTTAEASSDEASDATAEDRAALAGPGGRILLVEDEKSVRRIAERALRRLGYEVVSAEGLETGLARFQAEGRGFDLLFSDVVLPDGSGLDLARRIRERSPRLPVLLTSGYTGDRARMDEIRALGIRFLPKPYRVEQLGRAAADALDAGRRRARACSAGRRTGAV